MIGLSVSCSVGGRLWLWWWWWWHLFQVMSWCSYCCLDACDVRSTTCEVPIPSLLWDICLRRPRLGRGFTAEFALQSYVESKSSQPMSSAISTQQQTNKKINEVFFKTFHQTPRAQNKNTMSIVLFHFLNYPFFTNT